MPNYILQLADVGRADVAIVGGKNASSGELIRNLSAEGIRVPLGFAVTADGYRELVSGIRENIQHELSAIRSANKSISAAGAVIRNMIAKKALPAGLVSAIVDAYRRLGADVAKADVEVAVRSSATAEDLPEASFAGQQESYLNVTGEEQLLAACHRCYASLFTDRAISYREAKGIDHMSVALSIGVQQMVRSDKGSSGVMFSLDPESGFPRVVVISASWGLGEAIVQGAVDPDRYMVFKPLLSDGKAEPIIEKRIGHKELKVILNRSGGTKQIDTSGDERRSIVLTDAEVLQLGRWAVSVENHYGCPMDMEWAKDGQTGALYLVQARPETVFGKQGRQRLTIYKISAKGKVLGRGAAIGTSIASGNACVIEDVAGISRFKPGSILVTRRTDPDWTPVLKHAAGVITEHGGTTSHAAIVSRELGIAALVGVPGATSLIAEGQEITLSCAEGENGVIYDGKIAFTRDEIDPATLPSTRTELMLNLADPDQAFRSWQLPAKGVGLARMEFIITNLLRVHPMALLHPERVTAGDREQIEKLTRGYEHPTDYFVNVLAQGIAKLAAPYHPSIAIVRLSDFKTNEYSHLLGGADFEPKEENPMIGFRGASRYYNERYREGFALECRALKRSREVLGFTNIAVMVPFCRTLEEADRVLEVMAEEGLRRGENGLQVYMMCEIPANVVLAREFARKFDGFSIGSNDLTQLLLGVDRDSDILAPLFNERNDAVIRSIGSVIADAHYCGIHVGICGEAPSNYADFAAFLVENGIDSISLNSDSFVRTLKTVAKAEAGSAKPTVATKTVEKV
jgi:pyruvate,water dikinase